MRKKAKKVVSIAILGEITGETVERFIYGTQPEGADGFLANDNADTRFEITLTSPGGGVDEGIAIYEMLRTTKADVVIRGYGIVGSIAALIFMAGKKRLLSPATRFFVHPGSIMTQIPEGIYTVISKTQEMLGLHEWYCHELATRSGFDRVKMFELCSKDSFFSANEALDMGIATEIELYNNY